MSWLRSPTRFEQEKRRQKRRPRHRTFPCGKKPGGNSCRWAAPAQANRPGTSVLVGTRTYCLRCHIDPGRNQRGLTEEELKRFGVQSAPAPKKTIRRKSIWT
jgi:hypothetical protein